MDSNQSSNTNDYEFDMQNLLPGQEESSEYTVLTEMVRNHYLNYLEKQLTENFQNCYHPHGEEGEKDKYKVSIKCAAQFLELRAIEACRIAQRYQRAMVKIIAIVRRSTQENKLIEPLEQSISKYENHIGPQTKETQTEAGLLEVIDTKVPKKVSEGLHITKIDNKYIQQYSERQPEIVESLEDESHEMTLDEKIEIFQKHLINGHNGIVYVRSPINENEHISGSSKRNLHNMKKATGRHQHRRHGRQNHHHQPQNYHHHRPYKERKPKIPSDDGGSPTSTVITPLKSPGLMETPVEIPTKSITKVVDDMENSNDSVAIELARLFSEEKTELDEIFGIDPNQEPDDPQICKILQEIEQAKVNVPQPNHTSNLLNDLTNHNETPTTTLVLNHSVEKHSGPSAGKNFGSSPEKHLDPSTLTKSSVDLSKSLWPCELFMQKRKLSDSLARLIEEDLRWHDIIKWKFVELFGEDSDDEFTPCSPSIELDDVLMGSCVKRISLWVVKHLMKPMKHGLIGNRFVFKKLAKHIARSIITENQYPDESIIKGCVENYFCLHQAVMTLDDLQQEVPSISLI